MKPPVDFGSYDPADVTFLLKDLGDVEIELEVEAKERLTRSGRHYSETLPVEYQPDPAYLELFEQALTRSGARVATAVGVVTDLVLAAKPDPVLVSLARAGTPIGILMRRWAQWRYGVDLTHYSLSIIRGRGIDQNALRYVLDQHPASSVQFVDGWTGKGAITRELTAAVAPLGLDDTLAVLADPGRCVPLYGTRDDFLVPSACLNSTVSGLVSRTVLRDDLIGPDDFHGAKFYRHLAPKDLSRRFIDDIAGYFPAVAADVDTERARLAATDRSPTWAGWRAVERLGVEYGIDDPLMIKPGVGETTRVLLRRVPWRIVVAPGREADLAHILALADARGVPVEERADLPFSCVGLIRGTGAQ